MTPYKPDKPLQLNRRQRGRFGVLVASIYTTPKRVWLFRRPTELWC